MQHSDLVEMLKCEVLVMNNKIINEVYKSSIFQFQELFLSVLSSYLSFDLDLSTKDDNLISKQIENMEILISEGRSSGETFSTTDEKKKLFDYPKTKLKNEIIDDLNEIPDEQKSSFYYAILFMYSYNRYLSMHLLNVRAFGIKYNLPIDNYTASIIEEINNLVDYSYKNLLLENIETSLDKSMHTILLLLLLYSGINDNNILEKEVVNQIFMVDNFEGLFWKGFSLYQLIHLEYDLTLGVDRNLEISFDENLILDSNKERKADNLKASDLDYKFYDNQSEINNRLKQTIEVELKKKLGFNIFEADLAFNYLLKELLNMNDLIILSRDEWIIKIIDSGVQLTSAMALFDFFSLAYIDNDNSSEISFNSLVALSENIQEKAFIKISEKLYISNCTLVKFAYNLFNHNVYSFPAKYIGGNKNIDKIANTFCEMVANKLKTSFDKAIIIQNVHLSGICGVDCEIDILFIYKNQIFIFECKRLAFPQNDIKMRNQYKQLENAYKKQLNEEVKKFTSNTHIILEHFIKDYPEILLDIDYIISGYVVTKEYTLAHALKKNSHILHYNKLIDFLEEELANRIND